MSQENLSPGNSVAATVMSLTINVATVYPKEILSCRSTWIGPNTTYTIASFLL